MWYATYVHRQHWSDSLGSIYLFLNSMYMLATMCIEEEAVSLGKDDMHERDWREETKEKNDGITF